MIHKKYGEGTIVALKGKSVDISYDNGIIKRYAIKVLLNSDSFRKK